MAFTIRFRRGTAAQAAASSTVLALGEPALETDTGRLRVGDGATATEDLDYYPTATEQQASYGHVGVNLSTYGIAAATDLTTVLDAAIGDGVRHVVIPYRSTPWPLTTQFTYGGSDELIIEFERGARVTVNKPNEAAMDLTNTTIRHGSFTSPYTGPTSSADWSSYALATPGDPDENYGSAARVVILRDNCRIEGSYYHEYACSGLQVLGAHVKILCDVAFHGMRHRTGWAEGIHVDGGLGGVYDFDCFGSVTVTDSDRGIEVEEGVYDITFHGGGRMVNVFPNGYAGKPTQANVDAGTAPDPGSKYANYTFTVGVHSHAGGGGARNVKFLSEWVLENCGSGATMVRSSGSNDADLASDCLVETVIIRGRGLAPGYLAADLEGYNNRIGALSIIDSGTYVGGTGATARTRFGTGRGNSIGVLRAEKFSLPFVTVESGADSGRIERLEVLDGKLSETSATGYLVDVAGPRFRIGELRARDVAGTLGYVRFQSTATDGQIDAADLSVKSGETIETITDLTAGAKVGRTKHPILSSGNRSARYVALAGPSVGTAQFSNGVLRLVPVYVGSDIKVDKVAAEVTVAGDAGCVVRIGVFTDAQGLPGSPVIDATVAGDAIAVAEATLGSAVPLAPGWYWVGGAAQGVTVTAPTVRTTAGASPNYPILGTTAANVMQSAQAGHTKTGVTGALSAFGTTPSPVTTAPRIVARLV